MRRWLAILVGWGALLLGIAAGMATVSEEAAVRATYRPERFVDWGESLHQSLARLPGVAMSYKDYDAGQVVLAVWSQEAFARVERHLRQRRIPVGAVRFEQSEGLLSEERPLAGCQLERGVPLPDPGPIRLAFSKEQVRAGEVLSFTILGLDPSQAVRGIDSYLECWDGERWSTRFILLTNGQTGPYAVLQGPVVIKDLGLMGLGPEPIRLPAQLLPGWYRIRKDSPIHRGDGQPEPPIYGYLRVIP